MTETISIHADGADDLIAWFQSRPAALDAQLGIAFSTIATALYARVLDNLTGDVLNAGNGRLREAITPSSDNRSARVYVSTADAPYAGALEFGASIPEQLITAKNGKGLAFVVGGRQVFAKQVTHPAFVLPPHSFLRSALADIEPDAFAMLDDAVVEAMTA
jgi:phage gpG-like protein